MEDKAKYVIRCDYSGWRKRPGGFAKSLNDAARYDLAEARQIVARYSDHEHLLMAPESLERQLEIVQSFLDAVERGDPPQLIERPIEVGDRVVWRDGGGTVWEVDRLSSGPGHRPVASMFQVDEPRIRTAGYVDLLKRVS